MPIRDKVDIQRQVLTSMRQLGRRAFVGPVVLGITLQTSAQNPAHAQTIAKNLLDLFARPLEVLGTARKGLIYFDDSQIQGLSVTCHHGNDTPNIFIDARPVGAFVADLRIAHDWVNASDDDHRIDDAMDDAIDNYRKIIREEAHWRQVYGPAYCRILSFDRWRAQEAILKQASLTIRDLATMYLAEPLTDLRDLFASLFARSPLRVRLDELPHVRGTTDAYKASIDAALTAFKRKHSWVLDPLMMPVALEVIVRPPSLQQRDAKHDLDNVVRNYLLPRVLDILKPVSDYAFSKVFEELQEMERKDVIVRDRKLPPKGTRLGVTRYEVWRLPKAKPGESGFVTLGIVDDMAGCDTMISKVDDAVDEWLDSLE
jgi:Holliday junction resolvase RusA-like endonuclease